MTPATKTTIPRLGDTADAPKHTATNTETKKHTSNERTGEIPIKRTKQNGGKQGRESGRERVKEISMYGCLSRIPYWGPGLQPRHMS